MPTTIFAEEFDAPTPPALPGSGLTYQSTTTEWATSSAQFNTSPNSGLKKAASGANIMCWYPTLDGNGGDQQVTVYIRIESTNAANVNLSILVRLTTSSNTYATATAYRLRLVVGTGLQYFKLIAGASTAIGSIVGASAIVAGTWYKITAKVSGTTLSATVVRPSDGFYMDSSSTFSSTPATCLSFTDSAVSGQGFGGVAGLNGAGAPGTMYFDSFLFESLASGTPGTVSCNCPNANSSMLACAVSAGATVSMNCPNTTALCLACSVSAGATINCNCPNANSSMLPCSISYGYTVSCSCPSASCSMLAGAASSGTLVTCATATSSALMLSGSLSAGAFVNCGTMTAVAQSYPVASMSTAGPLILTSSGMYADRLSLGAFNDITSVGGLNDNMTIGGGIA